MTEYIKIKQARIGNLNARFYLASAFGAAALLFAFAYIFLMNFTIYKEYAAERLEQVVNDEQTELQALESDYIAKLSELDVEAPARLGFVAANAKFVRVSGSVAMAGIGIR